MNLLPDLAFYFDNQKILWSLWWFVPLFNLSTTRFIIDHPWLAFAYDFYLFIWFEEMKSIVCLYLHTIFLIVLFSLISFCTWPFLDLQADAYVKSIFWHLIFIVYNTVERISIAVWDTLNGFWLEWLTLKPFASQTFKTFRANFISFNPTISKVFIFKPAQSLLILDLWYCAHHSIPICV